MQQEGRLFGFSPPIDVEEGMVVDVEVPY